MKLSEKRKQKKILKEVHDILEDILEDNEVSFVEIIHALSKILKFIEKI